MPYVPGVARGVLTRGLRGDPSGMIVLLDGTPAANAPAPAGFVVVDGAPFSHDSIPLLNSGVPCIMVTREQAKGLREGMEALLDGATGLLTTDLGAPVTPPPEPGGAPVTHTADGVRVRLRVSARSLEAVQRGIEIGAEGVGLLRSEFLGPADGRVPDAAFYLDAFRELCAAADGRPLTIRLFDLSVSKRPAWLDLSKNDTGVLGRQGVRLYRDEPVSGVYSAQLAAIAELADDYDIRVLLPYVADLEELRYWCDDIARRLGRPVTRGAMAETPAAALVLREWLEVAEFAAIGCNDLMQCLFGADRDRPEVQRYLDPHAPALFRFLRQAAEAAGERLDAVQLCGVLPQLPGILPLLLGLGFRTFSVEPAMLAYLWRTVAETDTEAARGLAEKVCGERESAAVRGLLGLAARGD